MTFSRGIPQHLEVEHPQLAGKPPTVVIPCYGEVHESLLPLTGKLSPAMIPLDGKPVIFHTIRYLLERGCSEFIVPVRKDDSFLCSFLQEVFGDRARFVFPIPDRDGDLGYTLLCASPHIQTEHVLIVLGDTYFNLPKDELLAVERSFVLVHPVSDVSRWCLAELNEERKVEQLIDKPKQYEGDPLALIGVYGIAHWAAFVESLTEELGATAERERARVSLPNALARYGQRESIDGIVTNEWFDCGHSDMLLHSQRRLLQAREFNTLEFDSVRGVITKRSRNKQKFLDEIEYYRLLPEELKVFFPRVVDYESSWENLSLSLEYYGYSTLSESLLFEKLDLRIWSAIFEHLSIIHNRFCAYGAELGSKPISDMYMARVEERLDALRERESLRRLMMSKKVRLNGGPLPEFSVLWRALRPELERLIETAEWRVIHGDLCFSNILYDLNGRICKLIDPRGSFGVRGIYGDPRYDIAKLYHSIDGHYDFIVNDLFSISVVDDSVELRVGAGKHVELIQREFEEIFFQSYSRREIRLLEGLLFLSMGVFHADSEKRQIAFLMVGMEILTRVLEGER